MLLSSLLTPRRQGGLQRRHVTVVLPSIALQLSLGGVPEANKTELVSTRTAWHVFTEVKVFQEEATLWTTPNRRTSIQLADRLRWTAGHVGDPRVSPRLAVGVAAMAGVTRFPVSMATPAVLEWIVHVTHSGAERAGYTGRELLDC